MPRCATLTTSILHEAFTSMSKSAKDKVANPPDLSDNSDPFMASALVYMVDALHEQCRMIGEVLKRQGRPSLSFVQDGRHEVLRALEDLGNYAEAAAELFVATAPNDPELNAFAATTLRKVSVSFREDLARIRADVARIRAATTQRAS